jgi:hypothetical protein
MKPNRLKASFAQKIVVVDTAEWAAASLIVAFRNERNAPAFR